MTKLNQLVAVEKGVKSRAHQALSDLHHRNQVGALWSGIARTYSKKDDEGDDLPPESTHVQLTAADQLGGAAEALTRLFDVVATKDAANTDAKADVKVGERVILRAVPVTTLLFLEKQLTDLRTYITQIPTLDPASTWTFDDEAGWWQTDPVQTTKTVKVPRNHVVAEATDKHPAQVQVYTEDKVVGTWTTRKLHGGMPATRRAQLLARVDELATAVKFAREEANQAEVTDVHIADSVFRYLLAPA